VDARKNLDNLAFTALADSADSAAFAEDAARTALSENSDVTAARKTGPATGLCDRKCQHFWHRNITVQEHILQRQ
jgi:hypothetical protein